MENLTPSQHQMVYECLERIEGLPHRQQDAVIDNILDVVVRKVVRNARRGAEEPDPDSLPSGFEIDNFVILQKIGAGGCGTVYRAQQHFEVGGRTVALKTVKQSLLNDLGVERGLSMFTEEVAKLARLEHPGVVGLISHGWFRLSQDSVCKYPYFVMKWVEGVGIVSACRGLKLSDRIKRFLPVCDAVQEAHRNDVVHFDLKPGNIMWDARQNRPVVLDFGIAKVFRKPRQYLCRYGTPEYMSPEQLDANIGVPYFQSDVYALGIILFEILADSLPYELAHGTIPTRDDWIKAILRPKRRSLMEFGSEFDASLTEIVDRAVRFEPEKRTGSPAEFGRQLECWLENCEKGRGKERGQRNHNQKPQVTKVIKASSGGIAIGGNFTARDVHLSTRESGPSRSRRSGEGSDGGASHLHSSGGSPPA